MLLVITNSRYWFRRYCKRKGISEDDAKYVNDAYQMQGYPRDTKVILTNGSNRLDVYTINKAKERFDVIERDFE